MARRTYWYSCLCVCRFVRWDNGSLSLLVGDECFDVDERGVDNIYLYARHDEVMQVCS